MLTGVTKNVIKKAAIARNVDDYIIDRLLVEESMSAADLSSLAMEITEDSGSQTLMN